MILGIFLSFALWTASPAAATTPTAPSAPSTPAADSAVARPDTAAAARSAADDSIASARLRSAQDAWDKGPGADKAASAPLSAGTLVGSLLQVLTGLAFLLLVAVAGLFLLRRLRGKGALGPRGLMIDVLETVPAGAGRHISLVRIHDRVVAVAFAHSSVSAVAEFTGTSAAEILAETGTGKAPIRDFASSLESLMDRFRQKGAKEDPS
jgi:flagellar biogenesis protein FliO